MRALPVLVLPFISLLIEQTAIAAPGEQENTYIVVPFENRTGVAGLSYLSLGLAATLAERLETAGIARLPSGSFILTAEQVRLVDRKGGGFDLIAAGAAAKKAGASHFIAGHFFGRDAAWKLVVELFVVGEAKPARIGSGAAGAANAAKVFGSRGLNMAGLHQALSEAATAAFLDAGLKLSDSVAASIATPSTKDAYAYLLLWRAYFRYFGTARTAGIEETALAVAEHAVRVDPEFAEARRFYASLLEENGAPKKAAVHYQALLEKRPNDANALMALGRIELEAKDAESAKNRFARAAALRPNDARAHFWLGEALTRLGDDFGAMAELIRARDLDSRNIETRRRLARLFAAVRAYSSAAGELEAVMAAEPKNVDAVFSRAACLRAAREIAKAIDVYRRAALVFPDDPRPLKFMADLLNETGRASEAQADYARAFERAPDDRRLAAILGKTARERNEREEKPPADLLGGARLVAAVRNGADRVAVLAASRIAFRYAANDAAMNLVMNGKAACGDGTAMSAAKLGLDAARDFSRQQAEFAVFSESVRYAVQHGEDAALTPDEFDRARRLIDEARAAETDLREIFATYRFTIEPLLKRNGCPVDLSEARAAKLEEIIGRDADRRIELPRVEPPAGLLPITPRITPNAAVAVRFAVNNGSADSDYRIELDGDLFGIVAARQRMTFVAPVGTHRVCLVPKDRRCGDKTVREIFLDDGVMLEIRPGKPRSRLH